MARARYAELIERAAHRAASVVSDPLADLSRGLTTLADKDAHQRACQEVTEAVALRDSHSTAAAIAFEQDERDTLSKLPRYETALERALYKALHELQRLQAVRVGGAVPAPVAVDLRVDAGQKVPSIGFV